MLSNNSLFYLPILNMKGRIVIKKEIGTLIDIKYENQTRTRLPKI